MMFYDLFVNVLYGPRIHTHTHGFELFSCMFKLCISVCHERSRRSSAGTQGPLNIIVVSFMITCDWNRGVSSRKQNTTVNLSSLGLWHKDPHPHQHRGPWTAIVVLLWCLCCRGPWSFDPFLNKDTKDFIMMKPIVDVTVFIHFALNHKLSINIHRVNSSRMMRSWMWISAAGLCIVLVGVVKECALGFLQEGFRLFFDLLWPSEAPSSSKAVRRLTNEPLMYSWLGGDVRSHL